MAKRKRKTSRKRRLSSNKGLSRRGRSRSRKGLLSEMFSPQAATQTGRAVLSGIAGGMLSKGIDRLLPVENQLTKGLIQLGASFVMGAVLKVPNLGAGIAGAYGAGLAERLFSPRPMGEMENEEYADPDALSAYPDALDDNGRPMYLAENGEFYYLEEFELAETFQSPEMYPRYVNSSDY